MYDLEKSNFRIFRDSPSLFGAFTQHWGPTGTLFGHQVSLTRLWEPRVHRLLGCKAIGCMKINENP